MENRILRLTRKSTMVVRLRSLSTCPRARVYREKNCCGKRGARECTQEMRSLVIRHSERSRGCNAADEVRRGQAFNPDALHSVVPRIFRLRFGPLGVTIADMPYEYLEEIGTADIAFEATGRDLAELFSDAADAMTNVMIDNIEAIQPRETRQIELSNDKLDMLLFDLLQELIFLKDAERLLLRMRQLEIEKKDENFFCTE